MNDLQFWDLTNQVCIFVYVFTFIYKSFIQ